MSAKQWLLMASMSVMMVLSGGQALAQAATCNVPVCDIPAAIATLRQDNQSDRAAFVKNLRLAARGVTDLAVLENLKDFADQAKQLFIDLKEEDWVIREAQYLADLARVGLLEYSPINVAQYDQMFDELSDESNNFAVLSYWSARVPQMTQPTDVVAISTFAEHARQWAVTTKRDDYFAREADKIITESSVLMSHLYPSYEGTYNISVTCDPKPSDCDQSDLGLVRMSVFDTLSSRGLVVSFIDSQSHEPHYTYINSELTQNATHIHAMASESSAYARVSELVLDIKPEDGSVTGTLKNEAHPGILKITGTSLERSLRFYTDKGAPRTLQVSDIVGTYQGLLGKTPGRLVVSQYSNGDLAGTFLGSGEYTIYFRIGAFQAGPGVLALTNAGSGTLGDIKLLLGVRTDSQGKEVLTGFMLNDASQNVPAIFSKK